MDITFLYGWDGYYFLQGFWLDIKLLIANASPVPIIICFIVSLALLLFIERKRLRFGSIVYSIIAALYLTFLLTVTVFGRTGGNTSAWNQIFLTYERALAGDDASKLDILYNIVLYVPVGLLIFRNKSTNVDIIILASMPLAIELVQLITTRGMFELTDVINNFIGGMIGLGIARLTAKLYRLIKDRIAKRKDGQVERAE